MNYFKLFSGKLPHLIDERKQDYIPLPKLYDRLLTIFKVFCDEANKFSIEYNSIDVLIKKDKVKFDGYWYIHKWFQKFIQTTIKIIDDYKNNITDYFNKGKYKLMSHGSFWKWYKFFTMISQKKSIVWSNYFPKSKRPKKVEYKYSFKVRKAICDEYYSYNPSDPNKFQNFTTFWMNLVNKEKLVNLADFSTLSASTLRKILREDERWRGKPRKQAKDYPFRNRPKPIGHTQMDVKVFGRNQTGCNCFVYSFDCIDVQSRIPYSEIIKTNSKNEAMAVVKKAYEFYKSLGIKITLIRTDNAMMFKLTNFVYSSEFNSWCRENGIVHEFIPLNEPQADGSVERYHRNMDDELVPKLINLKTPKEINVLLQKYTHWCTYEKYVHFKELKHLPVIKQYMKPIDAIKYFKVLLQKH